ncbi:PREDICTED: uncharacterized protein LOC109327029 [Lupinus angustifolius]|uniref:uncharacterized protein LOC109327029 n=1 Tax=Lupinus angustifolius TaxID=3871 RepID=UPI00092FAF98|nr:PREDICTED: uncharacterized protein LOC109327029 [Lupinus angustifolius]
MQRRSPPKHRHDGTSPLPLGMDWSPAPRKWNGRDTIWPHNHRSGWSYCVTIPSWVFLPKSKNSDPIVFYRVQVGIQSPEGVTTLHGVLRRFNDFLKLFADLKKQFSRKSIPPAPPKGFTQLKSRALLEERRCSLEEWMMKLLSDIDISRCAAVASFLGLEAAARSSFQDSSQQNSETDPDSNNIIYSVQPPLHSSPSLVAGSSSVASDYGSDTAYEPSELGTPRIGRDDNSEVGTDDLTLDEDMTSPMERLVKYGISNIGEGLFIGQNILDQLEGLPRHKVNVRHDNYVAEKGKSNGNSYNSSPLANNSTELYSEHEHPKAVGHVRMLSNESVGSEGSSIRGSGVSNSWIPNSYGDGSPDLPGGALVPRATDIMNHTELQFTGDAQVVLPLDQRNKLNRILLTMQRRLVTSKTDMEDLIVRLNQEIAAKDFLATKVKDLEVELEATKQKSKENLQQAVLIERERFTQMQWDMEVLRQKSLELEMKLKSEGGGNSSQNSTKESIVQPKDVLLQNLSTTKEQLEILSKQYGELEAKSKADIKVLVKEVKSLRNTQKVLKKELSESVKEKCEAEELLQHEREKREQAETACRNLLQKCRLLFNQLQECNVNLTSEDKYRKTMNSSSSSTDTFNQLAKSDDQIDILLEEVENLGKDYGCAATNVDKTNDINGGVICDDELTKFLADLFMDNVRLRKQTNSITRHALKWDMRASDDSTLMESVTSN